MTFGEKAVKRVAVFHPDANLQAVVCLNVSCVQQEILSFTWLLFFSWFFFVLVWFDLRELIPLFYLYFSRRVGGVAAVAEARPWLLV